MSEGFGLAEMKYEGDTIITDKFYKCVSVSADGFVDGYYFVIGEDSQPLMITKEGKKYFLMHPDKEYANTSCKTSLMKQFIKRLKGLFNE